MPALDTESQFKFLIACIKHSTAGKVDFAAVATECEIVSKGAAAKRYERLMKAHGIGTGAMSPLKTPSKDSKDAVGKKAQGTPSKKRKLAQPTDEVEEDLEEPVKGEVKSEDACAVKSEPGLAAVPSYSTKISNELPGAPPMPLLGIPPSAATPGTQPATTTPTSSATAIAEDEDVLIVSATDNDNNNATGRDIPGPPSTPAAAPNAPMTPNEHQNPQSSLASLGYNANNPFPTQTSPPATMPTTRTTSSRPGSHHPSPHPLAAFPFGLHPHHHFHPHHGHGHHPHPRQNGSQHPPAPLGWIHPSLTQHHHQGHQNQHQDPTSSFWATVTRRDEGEGRQQ